VRTVDIIRRKRDGFELEREEIAFLVSGFTRGSIPDYQIAAFLMAVKFVGMSDAETLALTEEMTRSGRVLDFSDLPGEKVDKHSTGGVGDKTSLAVAPLAAAAGVLVPMISGRALAHTGGTLDKLEAIPGFNVRLDLARFRKVLSRAGCALIGQTEEIAPADRKLYALRDVTATVESIPLIVGSILSKKLAEGIGGLVLDVKSGSGAFMKDEARARELAARLVAVCQQLGKRAVALLTNMDQPLGKHVGNALEVTEAVEVLRGGGADDLRELCLDLTAHMLVLGRAAPSVEEGRETAARLIASGAGLERLLKVVELQDGDPRAVEDPGRLPRARERRPVPAKREGFVARIDTEALGRAAMLLGAGRETVDSVIDPAVGLVVERKPGAAVRPGEPLVVLHYNDASRLEEAERLVASAYQIEEEPPALPPLIREVIR
jgi:pyrimidine-nucleoside phosphorylase/thymidine phosphorylase